MSQHTPAEDFNEAQRANARLIAAAPDLLAALVDVQGALGYLPYRDPEVEDGDLAKMHAAVERSRRLLAKLGVTL